MATPSPAFRLALASRRMLGVHQARCFSSQASSIPTSTSTSAFALSRPPPRHRPRPPLLHGPATSNTNNATALNGITIITTPRPAPPPLFSSSSSFFHTTAPRDRKKATPPPPTDFARMDVLADAPAPATAVEACLPGGFVLGTGARLVGAGGCGALLVGGEAFAWRPWEAGVGVGDGDGGKKGSLVNEKGQWEVADEAWAIFGVVWPRPDLLILGVGPEIRPISPATRRAISSLGMRVEVLDTRNAASQYNMLATERGVWEVAAALIPIGWKEGVGVESD